MEVGGRAGSECLGIWEGAANQTAEIWAATDLADSNSWVLIGSFMPTSSSFTYTDPDAGLYTQRFYHAREP